MVFSRETENFINQLLRYEDQFKKTRLIDYLKFRKNISFKEMKDNLMSLVNVIEKTHIKYSTNSASTKKTGKNNPLYSLYEGLNKDTSERILSLIKKLEKDMPDSKKSLKVLELFFEAGINKEKDKSKNKIIGEIESHLMSENDRNSIPKSKREEVSLMNKEDVSVEDLGIKTALRSNAGDGGLDMSDLLMAVERIESSPKSVPSSKIEESVDSIKKERRAPPPLVSLESVDDIEKEIKTPPPLDSPKSIPSSKTEERDVFDMSDLLGALKEGSRESVSSSKKVDSADNITKERKPSLKQPRGPILSNHMRQSGVVASSDSKATIMSSAPSSRVDYDSNPSEVIETRKRENIITENIDNREKYVPNKSLRYDGESSVSRIREERVKK